MTCAHVVDIEPIFVQFADSPRAFKARKVWDGYEEGGGLDLALIHVTEPIPAWFNLVPTERITKGLPVAVIGFPNLELAYAAGQVRARPKGTSKLASIVAHNAPLTYGDSGGPVVTLGGGLIGVNASWIVYPFFSPKGEAVRPDANWLTGVIDRDRKSR